MRLNCVFAGCEQLDIPQDGHARRCGHTHVEKSSVELHPLSVRDTVSLTHTMRNHIGKSFEMGLCLCCVTNFSLIAHVQLWWLWLRQRECAVGALSEGVCQNHGLSPWADHSTHLPLLLETLQTLWKGSNQFKHHLIRPLCPQYGNHLTF